MVLLKFRSHDFTGELVKALVSRDVIHGLFLRLCRLDQIQIALASFTILTALLCPTVVHFNLAFSKFALSCRKCGLSTFRLVQ